ncbi:MAG TPA: hypothetical protein VF101_10475 [Gaiellaceae bacterium]
MAGQPRDLLTMLADRGEEAIQKLSDTPGADRLLGVAQTMRERLDEIQKKVRGIDALERRVATLERRVDELSAPSARKTPARKRPAAKAKSGSGSPG